MTPGDVMLWCCAAAVCALTGAFLLALGVALVVGVLAMVRKPPPGPNDPQPLR